LEILVSTWEAEIQRRIEDVDAGSSRDHPGRRVSPVSSNALVASRRLRFNPLAEAELQDAASWYDERVLAGWSLHHGHSSSRQRNVESPHRWPSSVVPSRLVGPYPTPSSIARSPTRRSKSWRSLISSVATLLGAALIPQTRVTARAVVPAAPLARWQRARRAARRQSTGRALATAKTFL